MISIQQAAITAACKYLSDKLPDVVVNDQWPITPFKDSAVTLIAAGSRRLFSMEPRVLSNDPQGTNKTIALWQVANCTQPLQLDVWATSHAARDDIMARLDIYLRTGYQYLENADPTANGFSVKMVGDWEDSSAYLNFESPDYQDSSESIQRKQFRATYRGEAYMGLYVAAVSPRQAQLTLITNLT